MPGFEKAAKSGAPAKISRDRSGGVPNRSVLRFAAKNLLAPADILALQRVTGNQALVNILERGASASAPPPAVKVPILDGVNDGSVDPWTGTFKVPVEDASSAPPAFSAPGANPGAYSAYSGSLDGPASGDAPPAFSAPGANPGAYSAYSGSLYGPASGDALPASSAPGANPDALSAYSGSLYPVTWRDAPPPSQRRGSGGNGPTAAPPVASGPAVSGPPPGSASAQLRAPMRVRAPAKYAQVKWRGDAYSGEFFEGSQDLPGTLQSVKTANDALLAKGKKAQWELPDVLMRLCGWKQEDCDKYLKFELTKPPKPPRPARPGKAGAKGGDKGREDERWQSPWQFKTGAADKPLVANLSTEEDRHAFELVGGDPLRQGSSDEAYDTADMFSKFSGKGWAIFVMDNGGRLYAGQHKVGLFHHSSLVGGGRTAGAGEMKVQHGKLNGITNKSGHYLPEAEQMVQVFAELESRGVSLSGVAYKHMVKPPKKEGGQQGDLGKALATEIEPVDAKVFYDQYKSSPATAPH